MLCFKNADWKLDWGRHWVILIGFQDVRNWNIQEEGKVFNLVNRADVL